MNTILIVAAIAIVATITIFGTRRRVAARSRERAERGREWAEAQARWRRECCNVVLQAVTGSTLALRRDKDAKYHLIDRTGTDWRLYWGIGDPATGKIWDAYEARLMGLLSEPDWVGFHHESDDSFRAYSLSDPERQAIKAQPSPHALDHLLRFEQMLAQSVSLNPDRRSGTDRRSEGRRAIDRDSPSLRSP